MVSKIYTLTSLNLLDILPEQDDLSKCDCFQIPKSADDINLKNPSDMSYVFSGAYTPLSCKLIQQVSIIGTQK